MQFRSNIMAVTRRYPKLDPRRKDVPVAEAQSPTKPLHVQEKARRRAANRMARDSRRVNR